MGLLFGTLIVESRGGRTIICKNTDKKIVKKAKQIVDVYKEKVREKRTETSISTHEDPLKILKIRLAKGEITKEQYEELKKILES
ncbi:MAG: hypothetical protein DRP09_18950 [Candidatus Thorarchaeota archaeon]|nr:MAG: hypothetical protein DRP09_18950 [Candidatus Thorarchaeota archaeon]